MLQAFMSDCPRDRQPPRRERRPYRKHQRATAPWRAFAGARLLLGIPPQPTSQAEAPRLVASTPLYIGAAITLLEAEDSKLVDRVLQGNLNLLEAAGLVRRQARLVRAFRDADRNDRKAFGETVGVDRLFDEAIMPSL